MNNETLFACLKAADTLHRFVSRMGLLSILSVNSVLRSSMERSSLPLQACGRALAAPMGRSSATQTVEAAVSLVQEASDKALDDWKNQMQGAILIQDEAAVWAHCMGERLEAIGHAAGFCAPRKAACKEA